MNRTKKSKSRKVRRGVYTLIFRLCQWCGREGLITVSSKVANAEGIFDLYPTLIAFGGRYECCSDECYTELREKEG